MSEDKTLSLTAQPTPEAGRPLTTTRVFTAIYVQDDGGWWIAFVEELPNVITQGETLDEAREMLADALALILDVHRDDVAKHIAEELPGRLQVREDVTIVRP